MGKKSKKNLSKKLAELPLDIIIELLKRLPVKPLVRFKCVNKKFINLISSPQFIKDHLKLSLDDPNLAHFGLIFTSVHPHLDLKSCSLPSVLNVEPDNAVELDYPLSNPKHSVWIVGSFNGLLCISVEEDNLFIWNPLTRVSKRLPDKGLELSDASFKLYAFGFDERINDYKVVGIFYLIADEETCDIVVRLYSLQTDSWKTLAEFPTGHPVDEPGKFAKGSLHWAVNEGIFSDFKWVIVSLDLETEMYGEIEQPNYGPDAFGLTLGVLKGCLCVLSNFEEVKSDLWIMNEYGVKTSWAKLCSIPYVGAPGNFWYSFPIWISSSGELLMEFQTSLVIYNPRDGTFKYPEVNNLNDFLEARTYVESLVAPNFDKPIMVEEQ